MLAVPIFYRVVTPSDSDVAADTDAGPTPLEAEIARLRESEADQASKLAEADKSRKAQARKTYFEIMRRQHRPRPGDARTIIEAIRVAGITDAEQKSTARSLDNIAHLQKLLLSDTQRAEMRRDVEKVQLAWRADTVEAVNKLLTEATIDKISGWTLLPLSPPAQLLFEFVRKMRDAAADLKSRFDRADEIAMRLEEIRTEQPELFD